MRGWRILATALLLGASSGCVESVQGQVHPALLEREEGIERLAVAPLALPEARTGDPELRVAATLVARFLAEAFSERGVDVIPADDMGRAGTRFREAPSPRRWAALASSEFGADAVLTGELKRYVERAGEAASSRRPASVAFEVSLRSAPDGRLLWSGVFDETQKALTENVLAAGRYPGGGTRWLTAAELARWGARETVRAAPVVR